MKFYNTIPIAHVPNGQYELYATSQLKVFHVIISEKHAAPSFQEEPALQKATYY